MGLIAAYQMGLIRHIPEPPLPKLDADKVDASDEAYETLWTGDAFLGLTSYAVTATLAAMERVRFSLRHSRTPLFGLGRSAPPLIEALMQPASAVVDGSTSAGLCTAKGRRWC